MKIKRLNLGDLIKDKVNERGLSNAEFARLIGMQRQNVVKLVFEKASLDTNLLCVISEVLACNFFDYYKSNTNDYKNDLQATITIKLGEQKAEKSFTVCVGKNKVEIK